MRENQTEQKWLTGGSRVKAFVGHFGSGKTEVAINAACYLREIGKQVKIVDLDIVNPFFRTAEQLDMLTARGIEAIYPPFARTGVDMPVLGAEVSRAFEADGSIAIFDVGGDDSGAAALGRYKPQFEAARGELYYVVNPYRPRSETREQILRLMERIRASARAEITGIIANANLGGYTTRETIAEGRELIAAVARETGILVVAECGVEPALGESGGDWQKFAIRRHLKPEWMEY
ncbi:MAG: hypothetical protein ACOYI5_06915 [Christensenellales bacterium]